MDPMCVGGVVEGEELVLLLPPAVFWARRRRSTGRHGPALMLLCEGSNGVFRVGLVVCDIVFGDSREHLVITRGEDFLVRPRSRR